MKFSVLAIMGLGLTAQTAAPTPWATVSDRNVVAAAEIFLYRHSIAEHSPLYDVRVSMHAGTAYVFGYVDGGSRGALLRKTGSTWSVVGEAKGQFPPDVFSAEGVEPAIALMAVKSECPALSVPRKRMTPDQLLIAKNSYSATLPARAVKDIEDRSFTLPKISYRTCLI